MELANPCLRKVSVHTNYCLNSFYNPDSHFIDEIAGLISTIYNNVCFGKDA